LIVYLNDALELAEFKPAVQAYRNEYGVWFVGFARRSSFFLLLIQKKETKENDTLCQLIPALLNIKRRQSNSS
jgi:hypothetical protein